MFAELEQRYPKIKVAPDDFRAEMIGRFLRVSAPPSVPSPGRLFVRLSAVTCSQT